MLGKGLESLIPKKTGDSGQPAPHQVMQTDEPQNSEFVHVAPTTPSNYQDEFTSNPNDDGKTPFKLHEESDEDVVLEKPYVNEPEVSIHSKQKDAAVFQIEVDKIRPNPHQPRTEFDEAALKELANSIREFGVIQPLIVSKVETESDNGSRVEYELIAGERRLMASKLAGLYTVPVVVRGPQTDRAKFEVAIIENIQRRDLNPIETAKAFARLQDEFRLTQREIATRLGKSREIIANSVRLLNLPQDIQEAVANKSISESQARLLLSIDDIAEQKALFDEIVGKKLSVREIKTRLARRKNDIANRAVSINPEIAMLKDRLEELLGTKVDLKEDGDSGKIMINFYSKEELKGIMDRLFGNKAE